MNILIKRDDALMIVNSHDEQIGPKFGTVSDAQTWYAENRPDDEALSIGASVNNRTKTKPKSAWTPGPWVAVEYSRGTYVAKLGITDREIAFVDSERCNPGEQQMNARLIALAPEMAEALATLVKGADLNNATLQRDIGEAILQARALLARLEGGQ